MPPSPLPPPYATSTFLRTGHEDITSTLSGD